MSRYLLIAAFALLGVSPFFFGDNCDCGPACGCAPCDCGEEKTIPVSFASFQDVIDDFTIDDAGEVTEADKEPHLAYLDDGTVIRLKRPMFISEQACQNRFETSDIGTQFLGMDEVVYVKQANGRARGKRDNPVLAFADPDAVLKDLPEKPKAATAPRATYGNSCYGSVAPQATYSAGGNCYGSYTRYASGCYGSVAPQATYGVSAAYSTPTTRTRTILRRPRRACYRRADGTWACP